MARTSVKFEPISEAVGGPTGFLSALQANLGIAAFTLITLGLVLYLIYAMVRPERI